MTATFSVVETTWISESRIGESFIKTFRPIDDRVSDDMLVFALHSMGWIQVDVVRGYVQVRFDARAITPRTVHNLADYLAELDHSGDRYTRVYRCAIFTGRSWYEETGIDPKAFIRLVHQIAEFGQIPVTPTAIVSQELPMEQLAEVGDAAIADLYEVWRIGKQGPIALMSFLGKRFYDRSAKMLRRRGHYFYFEQYTPLPTGPWDRDTWNGFAYQRVDEAVPDRGLAQTVCDAAEATLESGRPRLERCSGPIRAAGGEIRLYDWNRLTLPVADPTSGKPTAVIMTVWERQPYTVARTA